MSDTNTNIPDTEAVDTAPTQTTEVAVETEANIEAETEVKTVVPQVEAVEVSTPAEVTTEVKKEETKAVAPEVITPTATPTATPAATPTGRTFPPRGAAGARKRVVGGRDGARGGRPGGRRPQTERVKPEFDQKILDIRRVVRVVSGGRRFSFSVTMAIGDRNGRVGLGTGKSTDTSLAIEKAIKDAKKKMITLKLTKNNSIPYDLNEKFASSKIFMMPNKSRGLIAGSSARIILNLAGVKDVTAKFFSGSKNKMNNGKVTMKALEAIAYKHGEAPIVKKVEMVEAASTTVEA